MSKKETNSVFTCPKCDTTVKGNRSDFVVNTKAGTHIPMSIGHGMQTFTSYKCPQDGCDGVNKLD